MTSGMSFSDVSPAAFEPAHDASPKDKQQQASVNNGFAERRTVGRLISEYPRFGRVRYGGGGVARAEDEADP